MQNAVGQGPRLSAVRNAQALRLSDTTVRRILHQDLNFHPYKLMLVQELNQQDFGRRTTFAETMLQMFEEDPELVILTSNEAHFHLKRSVNKQNFHYWSTINPRQVHKHPLHCDRVTVWAAVAKFGVIGLYFFLRKWLFRDSEFRPLCCHDPKFPCTQITQTSIESVPNLVPAKYFFMKNDYALLLLKPSGFTGGSYINPLHRQIIITGL